jgi:hypothetical protein
MLTFFFTTVSGVRFYIFFVLNDAIHRLRRTDEWAIDGDSILRFLNSSDYSHEGVRERVLLCPA